MDKNSDLEEERAYKLGFQDSPLTARTVSKLTGLDTESAAQLLRDAGTDHDGASSSSLLIQLCSSRGIPLPQAFLQGVQDLAVAQEAPARWADTLIELLRKKGVLGMVVDYTAFLGLTTFDSSEEHPHTGECGFYGYRKNAEGEVVGVVTGPAIQQLGAGVPRRIAADHQRDARLDLPATLEQLVIWISKQAGDVELAMPDSDEYPVEMAHWVEAVGKVAIPQPKSGKHQRSPPENGRQLGKTREDAMARELDSLSANSTDPQKVMGALQRNAGKSGSCVIEAMVDGLKWRADDGSDKTMDLQALRKRLTRLNEKNSSR